LKQRAHQRQPHRKIDSRRKTGVAFTLVPVDGSQYTGGSARSRRVHSERCVGCNHPVRAEGFPITADVENVGVRRISVAGGWKKTQEGPNQPPQGPSGPDRQKLKRGANKNGTRANQAPIKKRWTGRPRRKRKGPRAGTGQRKHGRRTSSGPAGRWGRGPPDFRRQAEQGGQVSRRESRGGADDLPRVAVRRSATSPQGKAKQGQWGDCGAWKKAVAWESGRGHGSRPPGAIGRGGPPGTSA